MSIDDEQIKKMWYVYIVEHYSAIKKEKDPATFSNMDEPGEHYAKWHKPDTERQILHDHTIYESKKAELIETG